jgi:hypothetical protein
MVKNNITFFQGLKNETKPNEAEKRKKIRNETKRKNQGQETKRKKK